MLLKIKVFRKTAALDLLKELKLQYVVQQNILLVQKALLCEQESTDIVVWII